MHFGRHPKLIKYFVEPFFLVVSAYGISLTQLNPRKNTNEHEIKSMFNIFPLKLVKQNDKFIIKHHQIFIGLRGLDKNNGFLK